MDNVVIESTMTEQELDDIVNGIIKTKSGQTYKLPRRLKLRQMILILEDIWEEYENFA